MNNQPPDQEDLKNLAGMIEKFAPGDGHFNLPVAGAHVFRKSQINAEANRVMSVPGVCIVAQGAKRVTLGETTYEYDQSHLVVYAAEVLMHSSFLKASKDQPYLSCIVHIDPERLNQLVMKVFPYGPPKSQNPQPICISNSNSEIVKAAIRLLDLALKREDADLLIPLVADEILIRLLRSPAGPLIAQMGTTDSHSQKISRAITWLKKNYAEPVKVEDLAGMANMSPSAFHQHFKSITSMSPVQFQKALRLQEARNLIITKMIDVANASYQVGYASASQFSREYSRYFGKSPAKDVAALKA